MEQTLPTDPTLVQGTLPNGLRYIAKPMPNVSGFSVRLVVPAGTLREQDHERGVADLLHRLFARQFQGTTD